MTPDAEIRPIESDAEVEAINHKASSDPTVMTLGSLISGPVK
jgi:hypothetical protein